MSERPSRTIARAGRVRRLDALFRAMESDFLLREQFVTGPSEILAEYLTGEALAPEQTAVTDRLIYAVFANKKLLHWFQEYAHDHIDDVPTTQVFLADFLDAVVEHRGRAVVAALAAGCAAGTGVRGLSEDLLHYLVNLHAAQFLKHEEVADETNAEEAEHDSIAVERDEVAGTLTAVTWTTYTTGTGTGTGTGVATRSPFTALRMREREETVIGPFIPLYAAVTLNELARYAAQLQDNGALGYG
ncbi:hypothetical protein ACI2LC_24150 [Nonomuraea wenchangensis]|uniref:hypothetical protein n=1 Tax=Nonomuraea wenchangensis TaxID=568860 RepID=UPI00384D4A3A